MNINFVARWWLDAGGEIYASGYGLVVSQADACARYNNGFYAQRKDADA
jgi:hypothetical protein